LTHPDQTGYDGVPTTEQSLARSKQGDAWAFRQVVEAYQRYAFSLAFRIVCNEEDARDIVQEAFIRVWKHIKEYTPEVKFTTWLYRIVVNLSYDRLKGERRRRGLFTVISKMSGTDHDADALSAETNIMNRDLADRINAVAQGLPLRQRMVFVLRDLQDLSVAEVAEILDMSHESVKTNLCYARRHIRLRLERMEVRG
jgi:RNA polymerase sigma-70 factor, ECF subfamily